MRNVTSWALVLLLASALHPVVVPSAQAQEDADQPGGAEGAPAGGADGAESRVGDANADPAAVPNPGADPATDSDANSGRDAPPVPPEAVVDPADLSALFSAFENLMDDLVQARSRIAVLGRQLFRTRVRVVVQDRTGRDRSLDHLRIRLDAAPVFDAEGGEANVNEGRQVFDGVAAPGPHTLTVEVSHRARGEGAGAFVAERATTVRFNVRQGELSTLTVLIDDDSDIAGRYAENGEGDYDLRMRVRLSTQELPNAAPVASVEGE